MSTEDPLLHSVYSSQPTKIDWTLKDTSKPKVQVPPLYGPRILLLSLREPGRLWIWFEERGNRQWLGCDGTDTTLVLVSYFLNKSAIQGY